MAASIRAVSSSLRAAPRLAAGRPAPSPRVMAISRRNMAVVRAAPEDSLKDKAEDAASSAKRAASGAAENVRATASSVAGKAERAGNAAAGAIVDAVPHHDTTAEKVVERAGGGNDDDKRDTELHRVTPPPSLTPNAPDAAETAETTER